jgi:hypothetical protein
VLGSQRRSNENRSVYDHSGLDMAATVDNGTLTDYVVAGDEIGGAQNQWVVSRPFAARIDEASESVTYFAWAVPGTLDAATSWRIMRQTITGNVTATEWADGNESFDNVWANRASLSYS